MAYLRLMRLKHSVKNGMIALPLVFSGQLLSLPLLVRTALCFLAFTLLTSAVYVVNDLMDVESDRAHPTKCRRPIASGAVKEGRARVLVVVLLALALGVNVLAVGRDVHAWACFLLYLGLNLAYSRGLKHVPIVDLAILMSGFLLRLLYGAAATQIPVSNWLYLTVVSMAFYLGMGKRRNELSRQGQQARPVLRWYSREFLDRMGYLCLTLTIVFYALWTVDPVTLSRPHGQRLIWTVPLVMLICMRYSLDIEGDSDGDPTEVLFRDRALLALVALYAVVCLGILYL